MRKVEKVLSKALLNMTDSKLLKTVIGKTERANAASGIGLESRVSNPSIHPGKKNGVENALRKLTISKNITKTLNVDHQRIVKLRMPS